MYLRTCVHVYIYAYTRTCVHTHLNIHMYMYIYVCMYVRTRVCTVKKLLGRLSWLGSGSSLKWFDLEVSSMPIHATNASRSSFEKA